jgi:phospholipid/cholesterol/gamma-HCH transport system substrate-binding protein
VSRTLSRWQALLLGLVVLAGLGLGAAGLFAVGSRNWAGSDAFTVVAGFQDIGGVEVGTRVRIQGIDAGEVIAVEPPGMPGGEVQLQLRLAGRLQHLVRTDARVQIVSEGLFAGKLVRILPGTAGAAQVADGGILASHPTTELTEGLAQATVKLNRALEELTSTVQEFRAGKGNAGEMTRDLAAAAVKLNRVLDQAETTFQALNKGEGTLGQLLKDRALYESATNTLSHIEKALYEIRNGEGTLGKLVKGNEVYNEALQSLQDVRRMVSSVKQNSDAIKALPVVRTYVVDPNKELIRPDRKRLRKWLPEAKLFQPGRAVLTDAGRRQLDTIAAWANGNKEKGSEVVVASFADPKMNADLAQTVTQKQAEAVCEYLTSQHDVHKTGFWWWSRRSVRPVGCGVNQVPVPEKEKLPPARIEVLIFVPEG